ncbi:GtrA family protein [Actinomycetospora straminea]|uniref:GtrA family protein n=1 Tax=Actinomycetospora straminea TaxID=663607 RepID=A0ABP9ENB0_9PSEU|nr:GtrA family protein [Actinomycetospora straminea]MDD7934984.1 GtrA family protein [Actinomycetospora straminea]
MPAVSSCRPCSEGSRPWQVALCGTRARLHGDDPAAQLVRFVTVGVISSLVYFGVFLLVRPLGSQLANLFGAVVSSALANELHRRLTFHAGGRVGWWTAQWEGGGLAAAGWVATATTLAVLDPVVGEAWWAQVLLIAAVTGAVGLVRFVFLRLWVFSSHARRTIHARARRRRMRVGER